jgi:hypothetical protein
MSLSTKSFTTVLTVTLAVLTVHWLAIHKKLYDYTRSPTSLGKLTEWNSMGELGPSFDDRVQAAFGHICEHFFAVQPTVTVPSAPSPKCRSSSKPTFARTLCVGLCCY